MAEVGAGLTTRLDVDQIAEAMDTIARDPRAAQRMGRAGVALVEQRYTWPRVAQQMIDAYNQVTQRGNRRP